MKKNLSLRKILLTTVAAAMLFSMTAVAQDVKTEVINAPISAVPAVNNEAKGDYVTETGKITEIKEEKGYTRITITNDNMGMVFNVENAFVIDQATASYKTIKDLKVGMQITALIPSLSPMTMSIPPMTSSAVGFVINAEGNFLDKSVYNDELVNAENTLKLNIADDTTIVDVRGTKQILKAESLKGKELLVLYTASTRSIPAQTTPEMVMLLTVEEEETNPDAKTDIDTPIQIADVELRGECEAMGFKITWIGNDKPIVIEKDGVKAEIKLGDKMVTVKGEKKELKNAPKLENGKTVIGSDFMELLK